jgi:hypothetical protein
MSDQGPSAAPPEQSGGGGAGGFFDNLMDGFADAFGLEISNVSLQGDPWVERSAINWRVTNSGNAESGGLHIYLSVVDTVNQLAVLSKDYNEDGLAEDGAQKYSFALDEFNQLAEDNWAMSGRDYWYMLDEDHRYKFEVYIDQGNGWGEPGSIEFGIEVEGDGGDEWGEDDDHGGRDEEIERLQSRLRELGFYDGEVDRKYGPKTKDAVRQMQRHYGHHNDDGRVNKKVRRVLKHDEEFPKASGFTY